jgi:hypothetical protein
MTTLGWVPMRGVQSLPAPPPLVGTKPLLHFPLHPTPHAPPTLQAYEKTIELLRKLAKYDAEFRERLALINKLLEEHAYEEAELVMNKKHIMDSFREFSEVGKLADVVKKQQERIKEHAESVSKKAVAIAIGAVKKLIEDEKIKCKDIKGEADRVRGVLVTQLEGFTTRVKASPLKGSPRARSASAAAPAMEEEVRVQYAAAMATARDEASEVEVRAAAALRAARVAGEGMVMVSEALELCRDNAVTTHWKEDSEGSWEFLGYFRLPEAAVADLAAVIGTWGLKRSFIAEYAWEIAAAALDGDDLEQELSKWGRNSWRTSPWRECFA